MEIVDKINNIIWHIENNRDIRGDKCVLDEILSSLKNIVNNKKERNLK